MTILVGGICALPRQLRDKAVIRRQVANRIGRPSISRKHEGLAAAPAEVVITPGTGSARLPHPVCPAEFQKCRRAMPDAFKRVLAHIPEFEAGDNLGGMTRKHPTRGGYIERASAPPADTGLGKTRVIIGNHRINNDLSTMPVPQGFDLTHGFIHLFAGRHKCVPVLHPPPEYRNVTISTPMAPRRNPHSSHRP